MKKISIAILLTSAIWSVCAEERIIYAASDVVEPPPPEKVTVYRLELHRDADGNEETFVVGGDGYKRPIVLVEPTEYKMLVERLDNVWQSFHSTRDGRRKLHGKLERTEIDDNARQKVEVYADGYKHTETMQVKRNFQDASKTRLQSKIGKQKPKWMSDKRWEMLQAFEKRRTGTPKTVTVEHDAATGNDTLLGGK